MKSYNPFKMWGSYVGLGIGILGAGFWMFLTAIGGGVGSSCTDFEGGILEYIAYDFVECIINDGAIITYPLFGFLIGWGIHSLARRLK